MVLLVLGEGLEGEEEDRGYSGGEGRVRGGMWGGGGRMEMWGVRERGKDEGGMGEFGGNGGGGGGNVGVGVVEDLMKWGGRN